MQSIWLVNGLPQRVDPADRGLAYGDGLFETMAAKDARIRWLDQHLQRLESGCRQLLMPSPDTAALSAEIAAALPTSGRAVVKLILTRGSGARGYRPPQTPVTTRILGIGAWPDYPASNYTAGISLGVCGLRLGDSCVAGLKHLCRLEQVLAQQELAGLGVEEGVLLDVRGHAVGGTMTNLFAVKDETLLTPKLDRCGVRGVMRRIVLETAIDAGLKAMETELDLNALEQADELFVTNALVGVWPVNRLQARTFSVGSKTRTLQRLLGYGPDA